MPISMCIYMRTSILQSIRDNCWEIVAPQFLEAFAAVSPLSVFLHLDPTSSSCPSVSKRQMIAPSSTE